MSFRRLIFFFIFLFALPASHAQGGATIRARVDKNRILIGEPLQLTIEANLSPESGISFVKIDTIEHFELLNKPVVDTISNNGGTIIKGIYNITSFDSGHWVISSFILSPGVMTDTIPVDVVFSDFDPGQDYHDIKDIMEVAPPKTKKWWWLIAGGALFLTVVVIFLLRKKKPVPVVLPKMEIDPYKEAMRELELLQREKPDAKAFHSKLTDIFRLYIFRKKGILSLQKTTEDLVLQLKDIGLLKEQYDKLSQALRLSDFVKFAKYNSKEEDDSNCFNSISESIKLIELSGF